MIACFLSNISDKYYKNPSMLSRVIAKNVGDVFLRHSVYWFFIIICLTAGTHYTGFHRPVDRRKQVKWISRQQTAVACLLASRRGVAAWQPALLSRLAGMHALALP